MQLDDAYANAPYVPGAETYPSRWSEAAETFRQSLGPRAETGIAYGDTQRQVFDHFRAEGAPCGTVVFVHGGYWIKFDRTSWSHLAGGALAAGWDVAMVQYDLCPDVRIADITRQVARAVTTITGHTSGPVSLAGHSAGGHLVSRMTADGVLPDDVRARVVAVAPISPIADLRPMLQTSMNNDFQLDLAAAEAESPVLSPAPKIPLQIWVGADERPAFLQQAAALSAAWSVPQTVVAQKNHFNIIDALEDPSSDITGFLTQTGA
ncbi:MAG: alpha/beta hydrolase [Pseudomonadota bacterium]